MAAPTRTRLRRRRPTNQPLVAVEPTQQETELTAEQTTGWDLDQVAAWVRDDDETCPQAGAGGGPGRDGGDVGSPAGSCVW